MKRLAFILAAVMLLTAITGCAAGAASDPTETTAPDVSTPIATNPELPIDPIPSQPEADYQIPPQPTTRTETK